MHSHGHIPALGVLLCGALVSALPAQRWQVDVGGTTVRYDTALVRAAASVAPQVEWLGPRAYGLLATSLAAFEGAQWTAQARGDGSVLLSPLGAGPVRFELVGSAGGTMHRSGYRTAVTRGEARLQFGRSSVGAWGGVAAGTGWTSSSTAGIAGAWGPALGTWVRRGPSSAVIQWAPFRLEGHWFPELTGRVSSTIGPLDGLAYAGWRGAPAASDLESNAWGGASVALWLGSHAALVVSGGSYASDLLQALPGGRYVSVGLRLTTARPSTWVSTLSGPRPYVRESDGGKLTFTVPNARRVELVGNWTGWQPVPLARATRDRWELRITLAPGVYRFNLLVDGERWIVPEDVSAVDDGFGSRVGLLMVP